MRIKNNKLGYIALSFVTTLFVGCGGGSSSGPTKNSGTGSIDLANYFPKEDISKTYITVEGNTSEFETGYYEDTISVVTDKNITTITTVDSFGDTEKIVITDKNITRIEGSDTYSNFRHVNIGDTFYSLKDSETEDIEENGIDYAQVTITTDLECTIDKELKEFIKGNEHRYTGDILKIKCINNGKIIVAINPALMPIVSEEFKDINGTHDNYNIFDVYMKKDIGKIAIIDDDCILSSDIIEYQDDRKSECAEKRHFYDYYLER